MQKLSWSALRVCHRRRAILLVLVACAKKQKRNDDDAHPETGATSGHSRRCMQPQQKHNDNAKPQKKPKKTARNTCTHWALLAVDMLPKIAHACSFMGLERDLIQVSKTVSSFGPPM